MAASVFLGTEFNKNMCSGRKNMEKEMIPSVATEGEHNSTGNSTEFKRWSVNRKKEAVLRMLRGEPVDALSQELCIENYRLEEWHEKALQGIEEALKSREGDLHTAELDAAMRRIGEISLENELLRERIKKQISTANKRPRR
jgi:transposase